MKRWLGALILEALSPRPLKNLPGPVCREERSHPSPIQAAADIGEPSELRARGGVAGYTIEIRAAGPRESESKRKTVHPSLPAID